MKYKFAIGIPTLNRADLLNKALDLYFKNLPDVKIFILDNGNQNIKSRKNNFEIIKSKENLGVARSWNKLCSEIFKEHDYALILNDDIQIDLEQKPLNNFLINKDFDLIKCLDIFHLSCFALTKACFNKLKFDEAFYPAYFEDKDYLYRMKLKKLKILIHDYINPCVFSNSATIEKDPSINKNFFSLQHFYMKKWGNLPGKELFRTPFNEPTTEDKVIEIIAVTYDHGYKLKCFIDSIRSQSSKNWRLNIIHDGQCEKFNHTREDLSKKGYLDHQHIHFTATPKRHNDYGHSLRDFGINNPISKSDYTVITNCDNYYVPEWISLINNSIINEPDFIYWDFISNHVGNSQFDRLYPYGLCNTKIKEGAIDMGSVAVKTEISKKVGFKSKKFNGDWEYFDDCLKFCRKDKIEKIPCTLLIHN